MAQEQRVNNARVICVIIICGFLPFLVTLPAPLRPSLPLAQHQPSARGQLAQREPQMLLRRHEPIRRRLNPIDCKADQ